MSSTEMALRNARMLQFGFLFAAALFLLNLQILNPAQRQVSPVTIVSISVVCILDIAIGTFHRARMIKPSVERLRANPEDSSALGQWRRGVIISFAYAESIVLFGFVLRFLGASWNVAGLFFAVGILLLLAWRPKLDVSAVS